MKKNLLISIIGIFVNGCCEDKIVASYKLSASERELIPFSDYNYLIYTNQDGTNIIGRTQPKKFKIDSERAGPESCDIREYESMNNFISFENKNFAFQMIVYKANDDLVFFELNKSILDSMNSQQYFRFNCDRPDLYKEEIMTNATLQGYDFENVIVFKDCGNNSEINSGQSSKSDILVIY